jgi:hypothetical protein
MTHQASLSPPTRATRMPSAAVPPAFQPPGLWRAHAGLAVWIVGFALLYGGHALGCAYAWAPSALTATLAWAWVLQLALLAAMCGASVRRACRLAKTPRTPGSPRFLAFLTGIVDLSALVSVLVIGFPILMVSSCV